MNDKENLSSFTRTLKKHEYIYENGKIIIKKIEKKTSFLKKLKKSVYISKNFITMDLETRNINGKLSAYSVSIFDGKILKSFYLTDFKDEIDMLKNSIFYLMKRKYHKYKVYLHNFSYFDGIFLLQILPLLSDKIYPLIRDDRMLDIKLVFGSNNYYINFRDSYLLLPASLKNLAINFNVQNKGIFPYNFVNNAPLNYKGSVPSYPYFTDVTMEEYNSYVKTFINKD